jgi:esterase/lipase
MLLATFLFFFILIFAFVLLIPEGKTYRIKRLELKKEQKEYKKYKTFYDETLTTLQELQSKNRHIIDAFDNVFYPERFEKQYKKHFSSLKLSKLSRKEDEDGFAVYAVRTRSHINSPKNFYDFLDDINKADWIIGVNFPINFVRDGEMIESSFTMKVYVNNKDKNATASESKDK